MGRGRLCSEGGEGMRRGGGVWRFGPGVLRGGWGRGGGGGGGVEGAVRPEVVAGRLRAIAEEMGEVLRRTAVSTNVKERLDYSCAVLDPGGELVVNAPHIPVHLGALGVCVRAVMGAM